MTDTDFAALFFAWLLVVGFGLLAVWAFLAIVARVIVRAWRAIYDHIAKTRSKHGHWPPPV